METTFDMFEVAERAVRAILGRHPDLYTREDWEDARQEALIGICTTKHSDAVYLYVSAKNAIRAWRMRWFRHRNTRPMAEYEDFTEPDHSEAAVTVDFDKLRLLLISARSNNPKPATLAAVEVDMRYIMLTLQGRSMHGIGMELGITTDAAYKVRARVRKALELLASGKQATRKKSRPYPRREQNGKRGSNVADH